MQGYRNQIDQSWNSIMYYYTYIKEEYIEPVIDRIKEVDVSKIGSLLLWLRSDKKDDIQMNQLIKRDDGKDYVDWDNLFDHDEKEEKIKND